MGDIDRQALGGAVGTGTHGTGRTLGNFSTQVIALRIALATGELVDCSPAVEPDLFAAARLSLGALGIVTRAHPVDVGQAAVGHFGIGAAGRDHGDINPLQHFGNRNTGDAGNTPDRRQHRIVGRDFFRCGDTDLPGRACADH